MPTLSEIVPQAKYLTKEIKSILTLKTDEEAKERAFDLLILFIHCARTFPNLKFSVSGSLPFCEIFIIGDKKVGSEYDMEMWKKVPILKIERQSYNYKPFHRFLYLNVKFTPISGGSESWKLPQEKLVEIYMDALKHAEYDFTMCAENSF